VLDRWAAPDHRYFKCRVSDGDIYILRNDVVADRWERLPGASSAHAADPIDRAPVRRPIAAR
jgi:hypothetical protein